jgi:hypothetical protein
VNVTINSGPISATDLLRHVPETKWRDLMIARREFVKVKLNHDCRCLVQFAADAELMYRQLGFDSIDNMISSGLELAPNDIRLAVSWLERNPSKKPISFKKVKKLAEREIGIPGGKPGPGRGNKTGRIPTRFISRGRDYDLARLARDCPDLAERVAAKEISANAAAIEAGFRTKRTPYEQAVWLVEKKLTPPELRALKGVIDGRLDL